MVHLKLIELTRQSIAKLAVKKGACGYVLANCGVTVYCHLNKISPSENHILRIRICRMPPRSLPLPQLSLY
jgi:hypothetical protein